MIRHLPTTLRVQAKHVAVRVLINFRPAANNFLLKTPSFDTYGLVMTGFLIVRSSSSFMSDVDDRVQFTALLHRHCASQSRVKRATLDRFLLPKVQSAAKAGLSVSAPLNARC